MKQEIGKEVYRKLLYFFENNLPVHFKTFSETWHNGLILDLNENKLTLVLREFVQGEIPFLLEKINPDKISKFEEKELENERN